VTVTVKATLVTPSNPGPPVVGITQLRFRVAPFARGTVVAPASPGYVVGPGDPGIDFGETKSFANTDCADFADYYGCDVIRENLLNPYEP
jgi:hypothetical protein